MDLYLVRHATSTRARVGVWGRLVDVPLEHGAERQLVSARSAVAAVRDPTVFSSPLSRCRETARLVCPGQKVRVIDEFRAYHSGIFEKATEAAVRDHYPQYVTLSYRDRFLQPRFGEESIADQADRVAVGLLKVLRTSTGAAVVVAHYSTINIIAHMVSLNWNQSEYADGVYDLAEGGVIHLAVDSGAVEAGLSHPRPGTSDRQLQL